MNLNEQIKPFHVIAPADHNAAGIDSRSINVSTMHHLTFVVSFGELDGNSVLKLKTGATSGTKTADNLFKYRLSTGIITASNSDKYGDLTTLAVATDGLTLTAATYQNKTLVIEVDPDALPAGQPWVTLEISDVATELLVSAVAMGTPRYTGKDMPTAVSTV